MHYHTLDMVNSTKYDHPTRKDLDQYIGATGTERMVVYECTISCPDDDYNCLECEQHICLCECPRVGGYRKEIRL